MKIIFSSNLTQTDNNASYFWGKGTARITASLLRNNLDNEEICLSASTIYRSFLSVAVDQVQLKTLFTDVSGFEVLSKILSMYSENQELCENIVEVLGRFATKLDKTNLKKDTTFDWTKGFEVLNNVMTKHRTSRKIARNCLSIAKEIAKDKSKIISSHTHTHTHTLSLSLSLSC